MADYEYDDKDSPELVCLDLHNGKRGFVKKREQNNGFTTFHCFRNLGFRSKIWFDLGPVPESAIYFQEPSCCDAKNGRYFIIEKENVFNDVFNHNYKIRYENILMASKTYESLLQQSVHLLRVSMIPARMRKEFEFFVDSMKKGKDTLYGVGVTSPETMAKWGEELRRRQQW